MKLWSQGLFFDSRKQGNPGKSVPRKLIQTSHY